MKADESEAFDAASCQAEAPVARASRPAQVRIDSARSAVCISDRLISLTPTEFRLLTHLMNRHGSWVSVMELLELVIGTHHRRDTPLVRVHIHAVRRKLGAQASWLESDARRVRGYRWVGPAVWAPEKNEG